MKTLKKSLCLILALVFVLGLCTIGAGAANFTDKDEINYEDAVTVMQGLGILVGYPDGSFQPAKTVTRAEAAKMIAYMMLGEKYAEKLAAGSAFADVPETHWAAKYVNYCASKGIIKGYDNVHYGPNDPVTGIQLAKMLEVACGYGAMEEFGPDNWDVNAFTYAVETGIFEDAETADFEAGATREETALYVFNTLDHVFVMKYDVDMNSYDFATDANGKYTYGKKIWNLDHKDGMVTENQATGADYTIVNGMKFAVESGRELIGHKVVVWYNTKEQKDDNKETYYDAYLADDVSTVYSTTNANPFITKTLGELAKEMDYPETDFRTVEFFANGKVNGTLWTKMATAGMYGVPQEFFTGAYTIEKDSAVKSLTSGDPTFVKTANGSYDAANQYLPADALIVDDSGNIISAVKDAYGYGQVTDVDEEEGIVEFIYNIPSAFIYSTPEEALLENCYEGIAKDDYVIVDWYGDVFTLSATSTTTVEVTKIDTSFLTQFNNIYAEVFQAYIVHEDDEGTPIMFAPSPYIPGEAIEVGQTIKFFIGKNGMAFDAVKVEDATYNYVYITDVYTTKTQSYSKTIESYKAQGVDAEGNEVNLLIGYNNGDVYFGEDDATIASIETNRLYKVVDDFNTDANKDYVILDTDLAHIKQINGEKYKGTESHLKGERLYLTDATKYLYISNSGDTLKVKEGSTLSGDAVVAWYVLPSDNISNVATLWISTPEKAVTASNYVFVWDGKGAKSAAGTIDVEGATYNYYSAYIDGVSTTITYGTAPKAKVANGFYSYSVASNGVYTLTPVETEDGATITNALDQKAVYNGKLMYTDGTVVLDDIDLSEYTIVDVTSGYQNAKGYSVKITDADSLNAALTAGYQVKLGFIYDATEKLPVGTIYVVACE